MRIVCTLAGALFPCVRAMRDMRGITGRKTAWNGLRGVIATCLLVAGLAATLIVSPAMAQADLSVPFTNGFLGKDDGSPQISTQTYSFAGVPVLPTFGGLAFGGSGMRRRLAQSSIERQWDTPLHPSSEV